MEKVIAVVVTYNPKIENLISQQNSLYSQVDSIVYVDNGSKNLAEISDAVKNKGHLIPLIENSGIAKAQNLGIEQAIKLCARYVILLDQDSEPTINLVGELIKGFENDEKVGLVAPSIKNTFNESIDNCGVRINGIRLCNVPLSSDYTSVSYVIASGSVISIQALLDVGLMREDFFIDGVDFEWCLRAGHKGWKILKSKNAILTHELGNGVEDKVLNHSPEREYFIMRNSLKMTALKHIPLGYRIRRGVMSLMRLCMNVIKGRKKYVVKDLKALRDFRK